MVTGVQTCALPICHRRLAEQGDDDDARAGGKQSTVISDEQAETLQRLVARKGANIDTFLRLFKVECIPDLLAKDYDVALRMLEAKKDAAQ
jgi:hypothetical protein